LLKNIGGLPSGEPTSFDAYVFAKNKDINYILPTPKSAPQDLMPSSILVS
jgi:hypothetical protein